MCKRSLTLRALVNARLTAAAEEIFALVERTIAEYEEELCRSKEENQRKQQLLDSVLKTQLQTEGVQMDFSPESTVKQETTETPQIKEEPEEHRLKQEEEQLPECTAVCVKSEESEEQSDNEEDWEPPASSSTAQMETEADGDHYNQVQIKDTITAAHNSGLFSKYKCGAESRATVTEGHGGGGGAGGGEEDKKYECSVCKKKFLTKSLLKRHDGIHTGERPFSCSVCNKTFTRQSSLDDHARVHTGERPYSCTVCWKTFAKKSTLNTHMKLHTGERPFMCSVCTRTFTHQASLDYHVRVHTGEKPYSCSVCKKTFSQKCNLNTHMKIHTGEKPYSCSVCMKTFAQKSHLNTHTRALSETASSPPVLRTDSARPCEGAATNGARREEESGRLLHHEREQLLHR